MNKKNLFLLVLILMVFLLGCSEGNNNNKILKCVDENQGRFQNDPDNRKVERWCEGRVKK